MMFCVAELAAVRGQQARMEAVEDRAAAAASPGRRFARLQQLDVLRGIAILLVLGHHHPIHWLWFRVGWMGVDLFFVLSGFLVAGLLFQEAKRRGTLDFRRFLLRRAFKIYPSFYLFLLTTVLVSSLAGSPPPLPAVAAEFLFLQNYGERLWIHTWSLAVEEHFYLLLPLLLLGVRRPRPETADPFRALPRWIALALGLVLAARIGTFFLLPYSHRTHDYPTHLRVDALLFGVLLAYRHHFHGEQTRAWVVRWSRPLLYLSLAGLLSPVFWTPNEFIMATTGYTFLYLGFGGILALTLYLGTGETPGETKAGKEPGKQAAAPLFRGLSGIGRHSYQIYLWHMAVLEWVVPWLARPLPGGRATASVLYLGLSILAGVLMTRLVEEPFLRLRDRWVPRQPCGEAEPKPSGPWRTSSPPPAATPAETGASS